MPISPISYFLWISPKFLLFPPTAPRAPHPALLTPQIRVRSLSVPRAFRSSAVATAVRPPLVRAPPSPFPAALVTALQPPPRAPVPARRFKAPSPPWSPPLHAPIPAPACRLQPHREMDRDGNDGYLDYLSQSGPAAGFDLFSQAASSDPAVHGPRRGMAALDLNSQTDFPNMDQY
ncbi:hypothetical protein GQ55_6G268600 [Panicum hallii var. hallii]|uniref:Uncharacterized protein n=1 Tax=Panicum hallii var. hallii TaxID=1504633 RepID=A0A2T7DA06_9POAL|nr:hypothetical protein GQ55_6G268600 [Panicum hallii var. hallii]